MDSRVKFGSVLRSINDNQNNPVSMFSRSNPVDRFLQPMLGNPLTTPVTGGIPNNVRNGAAALGGLMGGEPFRAMGPATPSPEELAIKQLTGKLRQQREQFQRAMDSVSIGPSQMDLAQQSMLEAARAKRESQLSGTFAGHQASMALPYADGNSQAFLDAQQSLLRPGGQQMQNRFGGAVPLSPEGREALHWQAVQAAAPAKSDARMARLQQETSQLSPSNREENVDRQRAGTLVADVRGDGRPAYTNLMGRLMAEGYDEKTARDRAELADPRLRKNRERQEAADQAVAVAGGLTYRQYKAARRADLVAKMQKRRDERNFGKPKKGRGEEGGTSQAYAPVRSALDYANRLEGGPTTPASKVLDFDDEAPRSLQAMDTIDRMLASGADFSAKDINDIRNELKVRAASVEDGSFYDPPSMWSPMNVDKRDESIRKNHWLRMLGESSAELDEDGSKEWIKVYKTDQGGRAERSLLAKLFPNGANVNATSSSVQPGGIHQSWGQLLGFK